MGTSVARRLKERSSGALPTKHEEANNVKYGGEWCEIKCFCGIFNLAHCIENCHRAEIVLECIFTVPRATGDLDKWVES